MKQIIDREELCCARWRTCNCVPILTYARQGVKKTVSSTRYSDSLHFFSFFFFYTSLTNCSSKSPLTLLFLVSLATTFIYLFICQSLNTSMRGGATPGLAG
eukprot:TRINITY_DN2397_c1_g2_i1.p1 TRINITY_DN2397_c1_g2~~TRINITY_DN2397_c1_g2_i1.p1  ORF type:complete len:101 (-),score=0.52 TRINITY_DN2397_c1_g2_i1:29-331(-)